MNMIDINAKDSYRVDQITAMGWIKEKWTSTEVNIIKHCWENTGLSSECSSNMSSLDFVLDSEDVQIINGLFVTRQAKVYQKAALFYE